MYISRTTPKIRKADPNSIKCCDMFIYRHLMLRHVSRQLRLAYLAPEVLKRLTCGREASTVSLYDLCFLAGVTWREQFERVFD